MNDILLFFLMPCCPWDSELYNFVTDIVPVEYDPGTDNECKVWCRQKIMIWHSPDLSPAKPWRPLGTESTFNNQMFLDCYKRVITRVQSRTDMKDTILQRVLDGGSVHDNLLSEWPGNGARFKKECLCLAKMVADYNNFDFTPSAYQEKMTKDGYFYTDVDSLPADHRKRVANDFKANWYPDSVQTRSYSGDSPGEMFAMEPGWAGLPTPIGKGYSCMTMPDNPFLDRKFHQVHNREALSPQWQLCIQRARCYGLHKALPGQNRDRDCAAPQPLISALAKLHKFMALEHKIWLEKMRE